MSVIRFWYPKIHNMCLLTPRARLVIMIFISLWNLTDVSGAVLSVTYVCVTSATPLPSMVSLFHCNSPHCNHIQMFAQATTPQRVLVPVFFTFSIKPMCINFFLSYKISLTFLVLQIKYFTAVSVSKEHNLSPKQPMGYILPSVNTLRNVITLILLN